MTHDAAELDFETYSEAGFVWDEAANKWRAPQGAPQGKKGLQVINADVYSEHPSTEVLTMSYSLSPEHRVQRWRPGEQLPWDLFAWLMAGGAVRAHNAMFEWLIWNNVCIPKYGFPAFSQYQMRCSMATARVNALPGALGALSDVLQLPTPKDKRGTALLKKFSVPRDPTKTNPARRITRDDDPVEFEALCEYCDTDIIAERQASDRMKPMTPDELNFWWVDQEINYRGLGVDRKGVRDCIIILNQASAKYGAECKALTGFEAGQLQQLRGWLAAQGVHTDSLDAEHLEELLTRELPPLARRVLEIRALIGSASVKKLYAMELTASKDDRIRDLIKHHGARTGRPTGEGAQPLNMPRDGPKIKWCDHCKRPFKPTHVVCPHCLTPAPEKVSKWSAAAVDHALEAMSYHSLDIIEFFFGDALLTISGCLRGLFIAASGKELMASDFSAIEAVVLAMLAGEQWRIDAFRKKEPIYLVGAAKITGKSLEYYLEYHREHGDHHPDRQNIGKVSELACFAPETQVLTSNGWARIDSVTPETKLWDGVEFVQSQGAIYKGWAPIVSLRGVGVTPNHFIKADDQMWRTALQLANNPQLLADAIAYACNRMPSEVWTTHINTRQVFTACRTFDIAFAGPRNTYTVLTDDGPLLVHNCGFGGWVGSYKAFGSTEPDDVIKKQIVAWREASPAIVEFWGGQFRGAPWDPTSYAELFGVEGNAIKAILYPHLEFDFRGIKFFMRDGALIVRLLSGRELTYHSAQVRNATRENSRPGELSITYMTWNSNPKYGPMGWGPMDTYGGRLTENIVQATAHDILRHAILSLRAAGYPTVLHVYDEIVAEIPEGTGSIEQFEQIMKSMPTWAADWPIDAAGGWRGKRYRKG